MLLKTSTRSLGGVVIVDCSGKIVMGDETAFLRHQVKDLLNESRQIVLNLTEVSYLDSTGLGTLVGLYSSVRSAGGEIKLAGLTGRVKDLLQITKLVSIFEFYNTAEEAASSFNRQAGRTVAAEWAG
ncbi:MAG TPA: STAS domain-containing protein [Terriglobales bacterium]|nr:STAS domain-containing protein [Terriglobales bacterium]